MRAVPCALACLLLLCASTPPAWFPGAEWLVLPGLMALYAIVTRASRPRLLVYLVVCAHTLYFSWSLRHVLLAGWAAIGLIAGLYGVLMVPVARRMCRRLGAPLSFAVALALTQWLRAHMVQFPYPHGQPAHSLYAWPAVLGVVRWGGEPLANALLAGLAGAAVELYRSWRVADPPWRGATRRAGLWAGVAVLCAVPPPRAAASGAAPVRVVAIEPGIEPGQVFGEILWKSTLGRLVVATGRVGAETDAPALILWPESTFPGELREDRLEPVAGLRLPPVAPGTRLVVGGRVDRGDRGTPVALLLDHRGAYLAHQEKTVLVPAGEIIPFSDWLPEGWRGALFRGLESFVPWVPQELPGRWLPPLETGDGLPFGSLTCFDNAFDTVVARHVADGARLLVVLSNEAWYMGGGELEQMVAMTVFRALETGTPLVRCTVDGATLAVDRHGRILERLPLPDPGQPPAARILDVTVETGPGSLPPLAWLSDLFLWGLLACGGFVLLHWVLSCARLVQTPSAGTAPAVQPAPRDPPEGGS